MTEAVVDALSSDATHAPLVERLVFLTTGGSISSELTEIISNELVLRNRNLEPGCLGCWTHSIAQDEHL